jgi:hypothetical protein
MNFRIVLLSVIILSFSLASAQRMRIKGWRQTEHDSLDNALLFVEEDFHYEAFSIYEELFERYPKERFLKYSYGKTGLTRGDKHDLVYQYLVEVYPNSSTVPTIDYEMARAAHYNYKFDEATKYLEQYEKKPLQPAEKVKVDDLKRFIENARVLFDMPQNAKIGGLLDINTEGDEWSPFIDADESMLVYTYRGTKSIGGLQNTFLQPDLPYLTYLPDIMISRGAPGRFPAPKVLDSLSTMADDRVVGLSPDGQMLFIYRDIEDTKGDIWVSQLKDGYYGAPTKLKGEVNGFGIESACSISADGRTLYFSSDRTGGFGGKDIYRASYSAEDSSWVNVINLGDSINTPYDEDMPFIHPDGVNLFFSSKGHNTMGDYDIFRSVMNPVDSSFSMAKNMGYPINTTADDKHFVMAGAGKHAYLSSARRDNKGINDILRAEVETKYIRPIMVVKGMVTSPSGPTTASIVVRNLTTGKEYKRFVSVSNGQFKVILPAGSKFSFAGTAGELRSAEVIADASTITAYTEKSVDLRLEAMPANSDALTGGTVTPGPDGFVPTNKTQVKTMRYMDRFGDITAPGLTFYVQVIAVREGKKYNTSKLTAFGKVEKKRMADGLIHVLVGGGFKSMREAFEYNKKLAKKKYSDAFIVIMYKGKRIQFEDLERAGIFKQQ